MATTPRPRDGKRPHPAWRARRVTAVLSGVAFAGLAGGMAVEAASPAHATTRTPDVAPDPSVSTTEPWSAPLSPQTIDPSPQILPAPTQRGHTQTSGS
jgi:hypothetical protein